MEITKKLQTLFENDEEGLFNPKIKKNVPTADARLVESFKEIEAFIEQNDCLPQIESAELNESLLAKRLESIRFNPEKVSKLESVDRFGILKIPNPPKTLSELFENDSFDLFKSPGHDVLKVKKVLNQPPRPTPDYISKRKRAKDFTNFEAGFHNQQNGLAEGKLKLIKYVSVSQLIVGNYYVYDGMMLYISDVGEKKRVYDRNKERFRIIFENGTESDMYRRSLSARLYENGYAVVNADYEDKSQTLKGGDLVRGYIYVLTSKSADLKITTIKDLYKIGYSTTPILERIKKAESDPTYLMASVEVVDSYTVTNDYNPQKIEYFLHRIFSEAALDMEIIDKKGIKHEPLEWYSVPLNVINQAINLLRSGEITDYTYDLKSQKLVYKLYDPIPEEAAG